MKNFRKSALALLLLSSTALVNPAASQTVSRSGPLQVQNNLAEIAHAGSAAQAAAVTNIGAAAATALTSEIARAEAAEAGALQLIGGTLTGALTLPYLSAGYGVMPITTGVTPAIKALGSWSGTASSGSVALTTAQISSDTANCTNASDNTCKLVDYEWAFSGTAAGARTGVWVRLSPSALSASGDYTALTGKIAINSAGGGSFLQPLNTVVDAQAGSTNVGSTLNEFDYSAEAASVVTKGALQITLATGDRYAGTGGDAAIFFTDANSYGVSPGMGEVIGLGEGVQGWPINPTTGEVVGINLQSSNGGANRNAQFITPTGYAGIDLQYEDTTAASGWGFRSAGHAIDSLGQGWFGNGLLAGTNSSGYKIDVPNWYVVTGAAVANPGNPVLSAGSSLANYYPGDIVYGTGAPSKGHYQITSTQVLSAGVVSAGTGGTNGVQTVTGTTGTGTKFTAIVNVALGGITSVVGISNGGSYTANPTNLAAEPVTGAGLVGATLAIGMGANSVSILVPDVYSACPGAAFATTGGSGLGLTLTPTCTLRNTLTLQPSGGPIAINGAAIFASTISVGGSNGTNGQVLESTGTGAHYVSAIPATTSILNGSGTAGAAGTVTVASPLTYSGSTLGIGDVSSLTATGPGSGGVARAIPTRDSDLGLSVLNYTSLSAASLIATSCTPVATMTSGSNVLTTDTSCAFTTADIGKTISVTNAGGTIAPNGNSYGSVTTIPVTNPGSYLDVVPHLYIYGSGTSDAYYNGGNDGLILDNGEVTGGGSIVTAGSCSATGTVTLTVQGGTSSSTPATILATSAGASGIASFGTVTYGGVYPGQAPAAPVTLTATGCTGITAHLYYGVGSAQLVCTKTFTCGGAGYNVASPGTITADSGTAPAVAATFGTIVVTPKTMPLITTITGVTNAQTITLAANARSSVSGVNQIVEYGFPIDSAFASAQAEGNTLGGGRCVIMPPIGGPYLVQGTLDVHSGCLEGGKMKLHGGSAQTIPYLTQEGTWIEGIDPIHSPLHLTTGGTVQWINEIAPQYFPTSGSFTPYDRPYAWELTGQGGTGQDMVADSIDFGHTRGLLVDGSPTSGTGNFNVVRDVVFGEYMVLASSYEANYPANWHDLINSPFSGTTNINSVWTYMENNLVALNLARSDDLTLEGFNFGLTNSLLYVSNEPMGTYGVSWSGLYQASFTGGQFEAPNIIAYDDPSTLAVATFSGVVGTPGPYGTGALINVPDNSTFMFSGLVVQYLAGSLAKVGSGVGGMLHMENLALGQTFLAPASSYTVGSTPPFSVSSGGTLMIDGPQVLRSPSYPHTALATVASGGTFILNGNPSPTAQFLDIISASSVSSCGTATVSGTLRHITLNVTAGAPTSCTINLNGTLNAAPTFSVTAHGSATAWEGTSTTTTLVLGSAGLSGVYDIYVQ